MSTEHDDERFTDLLTAFDEAIDGDDIATVAAQHDDTDAADAEPRLRRAQRCVLMLEIARRFEQDGGLGHACAPGPARDDGVPPGDEALSTDEPAQLTIGRFAIVRELGRGGYGVVFLAVDPQLDRLVALKVPHPEVLISPDLKRRFLRESRAAAGLNHPNIVTVYEVGEAGPVCWIAAEYCHGLSLADVVRAHPCGLPPRLAAAWAAQIAEGIEHAHRHGILHRDLKPSNVMLVTSQAESSIDPANHEALGGLVPKVLDFGLAKELDAAGEHTRTGAILGTPAYMAPEQIDRQRGAIDARTDVYGLGSLLYTLLAGRPHFQGESNAEVFQQVLFDEPQPLRKLQPDTPADLAAIVARSMEANPARRYASAAALADDLSRFLAGQSTVARPLGPIGRGLKWAARRPALAALVVVCALAAVVASAGLAWHGWRLSQASEELGRRELALLRTEYPNDMQAAWDAILQGRYDDTRALLDRHAHDRSNIEHRGWEWRFLDEQWKRRPIALLGHAGDVLCVAISPDGSIVASGGNDHSIRLWNVARREALAVLSAHTAAVKCLAFSPDGKRLASGSNDRTARIWDVQRRSLVTTHDEHADRVSAIQFVQDGKALATGDGDGAVRLWTTSGLQASWDTGSAVEHFEFSPDESLLAVCDVDGVIGVWDTARRVKVATLPMQGSRPTAVKFSPDGDELTAVTADWHVCRRRWKSGELIREFTLRGPSILNIDAIFASDSSEFWSVLERGQLERWRINGDDPPVVINSYAAHSGSASSVAMSKDGCHLATGGVDDAVRLWDLRRMPGALVVRDVPSQVRTLAIAASGREVWTGSRDGRIRVYDLSTGRLIETLGNNDGRVNAVRCSPDGRLVASAGESGVIQLWDVATRTLRRQFAADTEAIQAIVFLPDGAFLASGGDSRTVKIWDVATGRLHDTWPVGPEARQLLDLAISADGRSLAIADVGGCVHVFDTTRGQKTHYWFAHERVVASLHIMANGNLMSAGEDGLARVWRLKSGENLGAIENRAVKTISSALSPDERTLVVCGHAGKLGLWDIEQKKHLFVLPGHTGMVYAIAFSPDGKYLVSGGGGEDYGQLRIWSAGD